MAKREIRKAKVIKPIRLADQAGAGGTAQPADTDDAWQWTPIDAIQPPADLDALARLTQVNRTRRSCIAAIVTNTVGLGYEIVPREGREDEANEDLIAEAKAKIEACAERDDKLHQPDFTEQISAVKWDEQEVGNGYLEVSRSRLTGEIDGFFHVIGKRARRRQDRDGWVVGPRGGGAADMIHFYDFGTKVQYDDDGKPKPLLQSSTGRQARRWDRNELIPFQIYTSESRDYGLPPDAQLATDYLADDRAADANAGFFDGSAVPPTVIFVSLEEDGETEGEDDDLELELDAEVATAIADTLRASSGPNRRIAIIPIPKGASADVQQLATRADRDIGFVEFRKDTRRAVLGAYRLAPIFVADIEDTNYSTASIERTVTKEQVFDGEQRRTARRLTRLLNDLGYPMLAFKFREMDIKTEQEKRESADALAESSTIIRREYRAAHGYEPLPEAKNDAEPEPGEVPFGWNDDFVGAAATEEEEAPAPDGEGDATEGISEDEVIKQHGVFEEVVEDAIDRVAKMMPGVALKPVVMEKQGEKIVIGPYRNGDGSDA